MSKKKKQVIIIVAVLLVLVIALVILLLTGKNKEENADTETDTEILDDDGILLIDEEVKNLRSIEVTTSFGTYTIEQTGETTDTDGNTTYNYSIPEYDGVPVDEDLINSTAKTSAQIFANDIIEENSKRLNEFGLESPVSTVKQTYYDGTEISFSIGNETPTGSQYYVTLNGESTIYEVGKTYIENLMYDKTHFIDTLILEGVASYPTISELTVSRKDWERPVKIVPQTDNDWAMYKNADESITSSFSQYKMVSPVETTLDIADQSGIMYSIWGMSADSAVKANPTSEELTACGFDNPYCTYEMVINGEITKLIFGNSIDVKDENSNTFRYGMLEGRNVIYSFNESNVYYLKFAPEDIITRMLTSPYIYNLSYIKVNYEGKDYKFNITVNEDDLDNSIFEYNGTNIDGKNFREFYQYLHKSMIQNISYAPVNAEPSLTVEYGFINSNLKPITAEFYPTDTRTVYVGENGEIKFTTTASYYERLIDNLNRLISGESMILSW